MHIPDLQPCRYHPGCLDDDSWDVSLLAIGWLEHPHTFSVGVVPVVLVEKLSFLVTQMRDAFPQYNFRGMAECTLCQAAGVASPGPIWSQENLIVPGEGEIYAAPGGIVHYVEAHAYCPPSRFVAAALRCPPCSSPEYIEALRKANNGAPPPMELHAEYLARIRRDLEAAVREGRERRNR